MRAPTVKIDNPLTVRRAIQRLAGTALDEGSTPKFASVNLTNLTASRLIQTDASKVLSSVTDLTNWVAGTANEIDITDDADGTITIGIVNPLIVGKGGTGAATLTDHSLLAGSGTGAITALGAAANGQLPIGSTGADPVLATITGTSNRITVSNGAGSITLTTPQDTHTGASPTFAGATLNGQLDVSYGEMTTLLGADSGAATRTDTTNKLARIGCYHYTNAEEPMGIIYAAAESAENRVYIGGGDNNFNAASKIAFYTAADQTTTTGTLRMQIIGDGDVAIGDVGPVSDKGTGLILHLGRAASTVGLVLEDKANSVKFEIQAADHLSFFYGSTQMMRLQNNYRTVVGDTAALGKLHIEQDSDTGTIPVLALHQVDVSEEFIRYIGTSADGVLTQSIVEAADVTTATLAGYIKCYVQDDGNQLTDQAYFQPVYTLA